MVVCYCTESLIDETVTSSLSSGSVAAVVVVIVVLFAVFVIIIIYLRKHRRIKVIDRYISVISWP